MRYSRLKDITSFTGKTHLFVEVQKKMKLPIETIGMADRGKEVGAGIERPKDIALEQDRNLSVFLLLLLRKAIDKQDNSGIK